MTSEPTSLFQRVRAYFERNPQEELTLPVVMCKFGCTYETARKVIAALRGAGILESVHVIRLRSKGIAKDEVTT